MPEFSLIERLRMGDPVNRQDVLLGIGDDCALLQTPPGYQLAMTTDTLVSGVHFPTDTAPEAIGYKSLAVNLSDLAACGAEPAWVLLALTLPNAHADWLDAFALGFFKLAAQHNVQLVGGDTTQGPLSITVQACGLLPAGTGLRRSGAKPGDHIYVTGTLGDAGLGLMLKQKGIQPNPAISRLEYPVPRIAIGIALRNIANAAIDISDGLLADLRHILHTSQVGATLHTEKLPLSPWLHTYGDHSFAVELALTAGDDYELCFTAPANQADAITILARETGTPITQIGMIESAAGLRLLNAQQQAVEFNKQGYQHFSGNLRT